MSLKASTSLRRIVKTILYVCYQLVSKPRGRCDTTFANMDMNYNRHAHNFSFSAVDTMPMYKWATLSLIFDPIEQMPLRDSYDFVLLYCVACILEPEVRTCSRL